MMGVFKKKMSLGKWQSNGIRIFINAGYLIALQDDSQKER